MKFLFLLFALTNCFELPPNDGRFFYTDLLPTADDLKIIGPLKMNVTLGYPSLEAFNVAVTTSIIDSAMYNRQCTTCKCESYFNNGRSSEIDQNIEKYVSFDKYKPVQTELLGKKSTTQLDLQCQQFFRKSSSIHFYSEIKDATNMQGFEYYSGFLGLAPPSNSMK